MKRIDQIFRIPATRRLRKEKKQRYEEMNLKKQQVQTIQSIYNNRQSRIQFMKKIEKSPTFQRDLWKMKELLVRPNLPERNYNIFGKNPGFFKTKKEKPKDDFFNL